MTPTTTAHSRPRLLAAVLACAALAVSLAACSSSPSTPKANAPRGTQVGLYAFPTNLGSIVTLPWGSPVYVNVDEKPGDSPSCTGSCAKVWVPVVTQLPPKSGTPTVVNSKIGTVAYNGTQQVTYFGHRLYYDVDDKHPLKATGQGADGKWYVILPNGQPLKTQ